MALQGIRIVEIGQAFAGPFSTHILGCLGAEVIKIERPGKGDEARGWGPPFWNGNAAAFHAINGNKRSLALDLKDEADRATCRALVGEADVLVHNLRPGALDRIGLGADALVKDFPRLIYAEISAYGPTGPMKDLPGYEILAQAFGGVMSITGEADRDPVRSGPSVCDFGSGMWLAIGILAALQKRHATGKGGLVQTSLFETALMWTSVSASSYLASGQEPTRMGASHHLISPYGYFQTATRPIMLACASDALFVRVAKALGYPEWVEDPKFQNNQSRVNHKGEIEGMISDIFATKPQEHWITLLTDAGIPCSAVNSISEVLAHPQTEALGMVRQHPEDGEIRSIAVPLTIDGVRDPLATGAPELGSGGPAKWTTG